MTWSDLRFRILSPVPVCGEWIVEGRRGMWVDLLEGSCCRPGKKWWQLGLAWWQWKWRKERRSEISSGTPGINLNGFSFYRTTQSLMCGLNVGYDSPRKDPTVRIFHEYITAKLFPKNSFFGRYLPQRVLDPIYGPVIGNEPDVQYKEECVGRSWKTWARSDGLGRWKSI